MTGHRLAYLTEVLQEMTVLIQLLIGYGRQLIIVLLQYFHGRRQNRCEELGAGLQTCAINIGVVLALLSHSLEVKKFHVAVCQTSVSHEYEAVTCTLEIAFAANIAYFEEFFLIKGIALLVAALGEFHILIRV